MSVRTIRNQAGQVVAYQAISGAGEAGRSRYFGVATHGPRALVLAREASDAMNAGAHREYRASGANRGGIPGLRFELMDASVPVMYATATGMNKGTPKAVRYSTRVHGLLGAVAKALVKREQWTGPTGLTPRQALARMPRPESAA